MFKYSYKSYKVSKLATAISSVGGFFDAIGKIFPVILIMQLVKSALGQSSVGKSNLYRAIIFCIIASLVMFTIGFIFNFIAKKLALKEFDKMLKLSYTDAEILISKRPELKEWFIEHHVTYKQLNMNKIMHKPIDDTNEEDLKCKKQFEKKKKKLLIAYFIGIIFIITVITLFQNNKSNDAATLSKDNNSDTNILDSFGFEADELNEEKYQCYVNFNNDIVDCYQYTINLYFEDKGMNETIQDKYNPDEVDMAPILSQKYDVLEEVRKTANSKPKMEIDEDVIKLADATEKVYDLMGKIYYVYGGKEYGKQTDKTKEELHNELLSYMQEYNAIYDKFSYKLDVVAVEHMSKDLKEYAKSGDMNSYYTLKIMMKSQKIYDYFIDNNITDENLFDMNLDKYNMLLKEYNEAYEEFEKQDIKGNTVHTESFRDFTAAYHSFVNNIANMVKEKNYDTGNLDGPEGLVGPSDDEDIQQRLYFYIDRMTSAYNSIQGFKEYFQE